MSSATTPDKIGRYQILERVGRGGMGVLYRGFDPVLDREVAVKVMLTDFSDDTEQMRPRFYREAKAVAKLQHRNIVTVFEFAEENNQPHIVMEFLRGSPLSSRMEQNAAADARRQARHRGAAVQRARLRAHAGRRPSRRQARQRVPPRGRHGQAARLRHREAGDVDADATGRRARQRAVHVAGAGRRHAGSRWPIRRVVHRRAAVRVADRTKAVRRRGPDDGDRRAS